MNKFSLKDVLLLVIVSAVIFALATFSYPVFFKLMVPEVPGAIYRVTRFQTPFEQARLFAVVCAAVPFACYFLWKTIPGISLSKKITSVGLIIVAMLTALMIRRYFLQQELAGLHGANTGFQVRTGIATSFENLNFEYWLTVGLLAGCLLSFLFLRTKTSRWKKS